MMMRLTFVPVGLLAIALLSLSVLGAPEAPTTTVAEPASSPADLGEGAPEAAAAESIVRVINLEFVDDATGTPVTHAAVGDTVTWVFEEGLHTTTESLGLGLTQPAWRSALKGPGSADPTFSVTFDEPGTYTYYCEAHPALMRAALVVA